MLPERGSVIEVAPGVLWVRMGLPFALDHINVWLLRDELAGETGRQGWSIVDCGIDNAETRAAWENIFAERARRPAGAARDRHAHAPRPHRLGALAVRALERAPVDQRHRLQRGPGREQRQRRLRRPAVGGLHGPARPGRRPDAVRQVGARSNYYRSLVPALPASLPPPARRRPVAIGSGARAQRLDVPRRLRPRARAHGAARRSARRAHQRRHGAAAHLDQRQRHRHRARIRPAHALPRVDRANAHDPGRRRWCCPRTAGRSAACTRASTSCRRTTPIASSRCSRPARASPHSAFELVPVLFKRKLDLHQMTFAMGESIAHCHALWLGGKLERQIEGGVDPLRDRLSEAAGRSKRFRSPAARAARPRSRARPSARRPRSAGCGSSRAGGRVRGPPRSRSSRSGSGSSRQCRRIAPLGAGAAPARLRRRQSESRVDAHAELLGEVRARTSNTRPGLALQPALHGVAEALRRRVARQADAQLARRAGAVGGGIAGGSLVEHDLARAETAAARRARPGSAGRGRAISTPSFQTIRAGLDPCRALALLGQPGQDPGAASRAPRRRSRAGRPTSAR